MDIMRSRIIDIKAWIKIYDDLILSVIYMGMSLFLTYQAVIGWLLHYYEPASKLAVMAIVAGAMSVAEILWFDYKQVFKRR